MPSGALFGAGLRPLRLGITLLLLVGLALGLVTLLDLAGPVAGERTLGGVRGEGLLLFSATTGEPRVASVELGELFGADLGDEVGVFDGLKMNVVGLVDGERRMEAYEMMGAGSTGSL